LVATEKVKLSRIMNNVESITANLKASNDKISKILGNFEKVSDDLVSADFKKIIANANSTIEKLNATFTQIESGNGTLGKLLKDEKLYNELVQTNKSLQNLVQDLEKHPERYIHFSVFGAKTKGVPITTGDEKKLRNLLECIADCRIRMVRCEHLKNPFEYFAGERCQSKRQACRALDSYDACGFGTEENVQKTYSCHFAPWDLCGFCDYTG
jgi:hypothetical protein